MATTFPSTAAPSSSSAESKDEIEDKSTISGIFSRNSNSRSGVINQEVTTSSVTATGLSGSDGGVGSKEGQIVAFGVKVENDTVLSLDGEKVPLLRLPSTCPVASFSSATSLDKQENKLELKDDRSQMVQ